MHFKKSVTPINIDIVPKCHCVLHALCQLVNWNRYSILVEFYLTQILIKNCRSNQSYQIRVPQKLHTELHYNHPHHTLSNALMAIIFPIPRLKVCMHWTYLRVWLLVKGKNATFTFSISSGNEVIVCSLRGKLLWQNGTNGNMFYKQTYWFVSVMDH